MRRQFTLKYWRDGDWYFGRLLEVPGILSQAKSLDELRENIQDAYELMVTQERAPAPAPGGRKSDWRYEVAGVDPASSRMRAETHHT